MARILVIDDDRELRTILRDILSKAQHEVVLASDGKDGLARYRERRPDLVITDVIMPEAEGVTVILEDARATGVRVIAVSGSGPMAEAETLGVWRTLPKPFRREELLTTVKEALAEAG